MHIELDTAINIFFRDPQEYPVELGNLGVLYLLRRDITRCARPDDPIIFPTLMLICAGIDLLAKFHSGSDDHLVGSRYKSFISQYFVDLSENDAEILYQFRNALLHSFGLYSRDRRGNEYSFRIGPATQFIAIYDGEYYINPNILYAQFEIAIQRYQSDLIADNDLRLKFQSMFSKYGTTGLSHT